MEKPGLGCKMPCRSRTQAGQPWARQGLQEGVAVMEIFVKINLPVPFCLHPVPLVPVAGVVLRRIFPTLLRDSPGPGSPAGAEHCACAVLSYGCKPGF